ncbi:hypothetical protein ACS0TY_012040 [Phlomoides rotata]
MDPAPPQPAEQRHEPSSMSSPQGVPNMGKHRMSAAISFLNQQIQLIQDELDELETIGGVSTVCPDLVTSIDSVPDPLLPVSRGPGEVSWDRWFQGAHSSGNRRRWI